MKSVTGLLRPPRSRSRARGVGSDSHCATTTSKARLCRCNGALP